MNIAIIPSQDQWLNNNLFDITNGRDNILKRFSLLKEELNKKGHSVGTIDKFDYDNIDLVIFQVLSSAWKYLIKCIKANSQIIIVNYANEPTIIDSLTSKPILDNEMFDFVLTWNDDLVDNNKYIETKSFSFIKPINNPVKYTKKKYLCMINYNKKSQSKGAIYYERANILQYFGQKNKIDLFGYGWDKHENKNIRAINQGPIESKIDTLKQYKYSIAFENVNNENGYICEKIFDSFSAYSVPIFYGAPNVKELIPKDTFIDYRDFENLDELNAYLNSIDEKKYNKYMFAIKQFMESDEYLKFTSKGFVESINKAIAYVSNKPSVKKSIYSIKWEFFKKIFRYPKLFWNAKRFSFELLFKW